jgi:5-methylcytosine-specific restriction protein B
VAKDEIAVAIRQHVITKHFEPARASGAIELTLRAGDLHKELNYKNRMPAICSVLGSKRLETEARVHKTSTSGPHNSTTTRFTFAIL